MKVNGVKKKLINHIPLPISLCLLLVDLLVCPVVIVTSYYVLEFFNLVFNNIELFLNKEIINHYIYMYVFCILLFVYKKHYTSRIPYWQKIQSTLKIFFLTICFSIVFYRSLNITPSLEILATLWLSTFVYIIIFRKLSLQLIRCFKSWEVPVVIIGDMHMIVDCIYALDADGYTGYAIKKIILKDKERPDFNLDFTPLNRPIEMIDYDIDHLEFIRNNPNSYYLIGLDSFRSKARYELANTLEKEGIEYAVSPPCQKVNIIRHKTGFLLRE